VFVGEEHPRLGSCPHEPTFFNQLFKTPPSNLLQKQNLLCPSHKTVPLNTYNRMGRLPTAIDLPLGCNGYNPAFGRQLPFVHC
jgi:hypothetical protein